jgi:hypothetical protein
MSVIRCATCLADPCGRWKEPPAIIFVDHDDGRRRYACRDHLTPKREEEIKAREKALGWKAGELR